MNIQNFIAERRDGAQHKAEALASFAKQVGAGEIPDYQVSAWLMAAYLNPLSAQETADLTLGMAHSGEILDLSGLPKPWVDKHSTGGVGDKTTLAILPLLASLGLTMLKMSGRGLGITGGTVDKLESIPGFNMGLSPQQLKDQAGRIGLAIAGQTADLAPADKVLYSLRDATSTVGSIPLIVSSILSKKLAGGAERLVLDVKAGSGAFMKDLDSARTLAEWLVRISEQCGLPASAAITDMSQPLGRTAGNAIEVREALDVLLGQPSSQRFADLVVRLAGHTLHFAAKASTQHEGEAMARTALESGAAADKASEWIRAQTAGQHDLDSALAALQTAPKLAEVCAPRSGYAARVSAGVVGQAVVDLGGGRQKKTDPIDHSVGIETLVEVGDRVDAGQPCFVVFSKDTAAHDRVVQDLQSGLDVVDDPVPAIPLIHEVF